MSNVVDAEDSLSIELSTSWLELPVHGSDFDVWANDALASFDLPEESGAQLIGALKATTEISWRLSEGTRQSKALVVDPALGRVDALISIRICRVTDDAYDNYLAAASELQSNAQGELLNRSVDPIELPHGPAVVSSDILVPLGGGGIQAPVTERVFLGVFPRGWDAMVEITLFTQNLALFADSRDFIVRLASGEEPVFNELQDDNA